MRPSLSATRRGWSVPSGSAHVRTPGRGKEGTTERDLFSAGLLSVLDALLDIPIEEALGDLPLADNAKAGIIDRSGAIGQALRCTVAYERVDWDEVQFYGLAQGPIRDCYMDAVAWSRQLLGGIAG